MPDTDAVLRRFRDEEHEEAVIRIFANGECCIRYVKSQLKLF